MSGNIYVTDSDNDRVQIFTSSGTFIEKFGSFGTADGQFQEPSRLFVDSEGKIYVTDDNNNRVQIFKY